MPDVIVFKEGGYRYIRAGFQFSSGVAAEAGFEIERARLARPLPLAAGFAAVEAHLAALGRPSTAFAACELRSAEPFTEQGFEDFNRVYVKTLARWDIFRNEVNPVARTNVCPQYDKPREPALYAFSYTVPARSRRGSFIVAGGAEVRGGPEGYAARTVRYGYTSADALREKLRFVVDLMEQRLKALGFSWQDAVSTQAYTVHDIGALVGPEIAARGAAPGGLAWHVARPPVVGLEFEMDVRGAAREIVL
ncbi:MAG: hypothetical protein E6H57_04960 [Betaproteobacteria bacterium]|nr:MAG: hypothetical protein E6H57_04960 [Betaproteobacteria bacterium]